MFEVGESDGSDGGEKDEHDSAENRIRNRREKCGKFAENPEHQHKNARRLMNGGEGAIKAGGSDLSGRRGDREFSALGWRFAALWGRGAEIQ